MIIAIDGNHSVGKTSIIQNLKRYYENNPDVIFYKFPSYTDVGNFARKCVETEPTKASTLLFCADYYKGLSELINPNEKK